MKNRYTICLFLLFFGVTSIWSQERAIAGNVTDPNGLPLLGVNILIKNTSIGTQTDFDGNFTLNASNNQILVFSYLSFKTQEVPITSSISSLNIVMEEDAAQLDAVLVTALGIKKEKKALGFAVTSLKAEDLEQRATGDITKILRGKAAGVNIISASGLSGAGSSVVIRGLTSTGNNQPLYVVDGVRFNSATNGTGFSGTSRSLDIDPNNIESLNVLKGLSATALYGADGKNGVILITTKAGKKGGNFNKKMEVTATISTFLNELASLPDYTNQRGQGYYDAYYNFFGNWGATFGRVDFGNVDSNGQIAHPYGLNSAVFQDAFPDQVESRVDYRNYRAQEEFFKTGLVKNINLNVNGGSEKIGYNLSLGNLDDEGFLPGNTLRRNTVAVGGNANLSNKINVSSTINFTDIAFTSPFTGPIFGALYNTPRSIDLEGWPNQHPITGEEISFQATSRNPYWVLNNTKIEEDVARTFGQISASYAFSNAVTATYQYGLDVTVEQRRISENIGNVTGGLGALTTSTRRQEVTNHSFIVNYNQRFANEKVGVSSNAGVDISSTKESFESTASTNQTVFGAVEHNFFSDQTALSRRFTLNRPGIFVQATLDYGKHTFITASARNDWTSNFENNSQFYPGVGISFLPTEAFKELKGKALGYLKLRANYGTSADFNVPGLNYPTFQTITTNSNAFVTANGEVIATNNISNTLANRDLKPALIKEFEYGVESKFLDNRVTLDASYFKRVTSDLIFDRQLDPATGFINTPRNVNEFEVDGIELEMNVTVLKSDNFSWDLGGNYTQNDSEVTELEEDRFAVTTSGSVGNYLVKGQPVNVILGSVIETDDDGNFLTDGRQYIIAEDIDIIGDPNPDFVASMFTALRYKNLSVTANLQYRKGGDIYSSTARSLLGRGLTTDGDNLNNVGFVLPGIDTNTGEPNEVVISSGDALFNEYNGGADQFGIFDGTTIRLQELALSYRFDPEWLKKTPLGSLSVTLTGENLYFNAPNIPDGLNIDTNSIGTGVNSNGAGIETGISPSSRRYGFSVKASF